MEALIDSMYVFIILISILSAILSIVIYCTIKDSGFLWLAFGMIFVVLSRTATYIYGQSLIAGILSIFTSTCIFVGMIKLFLLFRSYLREDR